MVFKAITKKLFQQSSNEGGLKYFHNTTWLFVDKALRIITTIFIGAWVARYLGVENFGVLTYSNSLVALFVPIAMFGLNDLIVKELLKSKYSIQEILGTGFIIKTLSGVLAFLLLLIYLLIIEQELETTYLILLFSPYLFLQSMDVIDFFFQSQVKSKYVVYSRIIALLISNLIKVLLIIYNANLLFFAGIISFELFLILILNIFFFYKNGLNIFSWRFKKEIGLSFLKNSWPLLLSGLMYIVYIRIDQIMVKEILGNKASGLYAVAITLSESWYFIPQIIATSFFPAILLAKSKSKELYIKRLTMLYFAMFWIAVIIAVLTTLFGKYIIEILYGNSFSDSFNVLRLYIWSNIFFFYSTISSKWLIAENLYIHAFYRNIFGAIMNISLNIVLLKKYGLEGAAISTLISYSFVGLFYDLINRKLRVNFRIKIKSILCIN